MSEKSRSKIEDLYSSFVNDFVDEVRSNEFYDYFVNTLENSDHTSNLFEKFVERKVDMKWVEAIENAIVPLDEIVRNPLRFIKNDEEIIPIEQARQITTESIRHLAQHTGMIASVSGDEVTPNKILNIVKNESLDIYENRFIYTLLTKLEYFIDKRLQSLISDKNVTDRFELKMNGNATAGYDKLKYNLEFTYETPHVTVTEEENLVHADISNMSSMQRIERIRKILYNFQSSAFAKVLSTCALVRPPLNMTNVLTKNQNFKKAVDLWIFIERYDEQGFSINYVEREAPLPTKLQKELFGTLALQYVCLKSSRGGAIEDVAEYNEKRKVVGSKVVKASLDEIMNTYDFSIDEIRHVFLDKIERKKKQERIEFQKGRNAITRALKMEKDKLKEEERERRELAEKEKKRLAAIREKERIAEEKRKEKARQERQQAREEKEKLLAAEKEEKAKLKQLKKEEKEKRLAQEKAEQDAKRAEAKKIKEAEKEAERKKLARQKAKLQREKAAEKERLAEEKAAQKAAEKAAKAEEKAKQAEIEKQQKAEQKAAEKAAKQQELRLNPITEKRKKSRAKK
ncbi:MAG: hypothetical protein MJ072_00370 [Clostridia bacterium]|nr:hypothetical protein [Clostridia bacterium]